MQENDIIVSEKLKEENMLKNHNLAKSIFDASFNHICTYLRWKSECLGKYYICIIQVVKPVTIVET